MDDVAFRGNFEFQRKVYDLWISMVDFRGNNPMEMNPSWHLSNLMAMTFIFLPKKNALRNTAKTKMSIHDFCTESGLKHVVCHLQIIAMKTKTKTTNKFGHTKQKRTTKSAEAEPPHPPKTNQHETQLGTQIGTPRTC